MAEAEYFKTILLVSDHQVDIRRIERQFMDTGGMDCRLFRCTAVSAAIEQIGKKNLVIDAIILDLRLDDATNAIDQYQMIKSASDDIPIIVMTGESEEERSLAAPLLEAGACNHIYKENFNSLIGIIGASILEKNKK